MLQVLSYSDKRASTDTLS